MHCMLPTTWYHLQGRMTTGRCSHFLFPGLYILSLDLLGLKLLQLQLQQQQQPPPPPPPTRPQVQASLSTFTACTVPASCRARSRFLNLRDSVKKSPTKSTAKVVSSSHAASRPEIPWVPFSFSKVLQDRLQVLFADLLCCSVSVRGRIVTVFVEPSPNQKVLLALSWLEVKSCTQSNLFFSDFSV